MAGQAGVGIVVGSVSHPRTVDVGTMRALSTSTSHSGKRIARELPNARLVEPPWGDTEWLERSAARNRGETDGLFVCWPLLAPQLLAWADEALGESAPHS